VVVEEEQVIREETQHHLVQLLVMVAQEQLRL
jgi:hypothetical protein